jgi:hypothetical protein
MPQGEQRPGDLAGSKATLGVSTDCEKKLRRFDNSIVDVDT